MSGPLLAPMYERMARTGPLLLAMNAPSPASKVSSLRPQVPGARRALARSRMSTPVALPAVTFSWSRSQRSEKWVE